MHGATSEVVVINRSADYLVRHGTPYLPASLITDWQHYNPYLPLMELAHREDPDDSQICFWLGRDYMWADRHAEGAALLR